MDWLERVVEGFGFAVADRWRCDCSSFDLWTKHRERNWRDILGQRERDFLARYACSLGTNGSSLSLSRFSSRRDKAHSRSSDEFFEWRPTRLLLNTCEGGRGYSRLSSSWPLLVTPSSGGKLFSLSLSSSVFHFPSCFPFSSFSYGSRVDDGKVWCFALDTWYQRIFKIFFLSLIIERLFAQFSSIQFLLLRRRRDRSKTLVLFTLRSRSISFLVNLITWGCTSKFLMDLRESIRREKRERKESHVGGMNDVAFESRSGKRKEEKVQERNETWSCTGRVWLMRSCRGMVSKRTIMRRGKVTSGESVGKTKRSARSKCTLRVRMKSRMMLAR